MPMRSGYRNVADIAEDFFAEVLGVEDPGEQWVGLQILFDVHSAKEGG